MSVTIAMHYSNGQYPVVWTFYPDENLHVIQYGLSRAERTDDIAAAHEFGECVRHSAECAGKFD